MAARIDTDLWLQSRRIAVTKSQIAALDASRLRLIEMSDLAEATALAARISGLRKNLEYQKHVLVAMQARTGLRRHDDARAIRRPSALRPDRAVAAAS